MALALMNTWMRALELQSLMGRFSSPDELRGRYPHPWLVWFPSATIAPQPHSHASGALAFPLETNLLRRTLVLGRASRCDLSIPDPALSESHVVISTEAHNWLARAASSGAGVWLNGRMLPPEIPVKLFPGDVLRAGGGSFAFESPIRLFERLRNPFGV